MLEKILNNDAHLFVFAKDKASRFIFCNEAVAEAAGLDAPNQIVGKTDYDLIWKSQAEFYRAGDQSVFLGKPKINTLEIQTQPTKIASILITKTCFHNKSGNIQGICAHYIDVTGYSIQKNGGYLDANKRQFYLGPAFANAYLTKKELCVFRYVLLGYSTAKMASLLMRSVKTVQTHIQHIAQKLQCTHQSEIVPTAIRYGLTYILDEISLDATVSG